MGPFKQGRIDPFVGRLDTYIGNLGGVRLLINTGGPVCRPYGRDVVNPGGAPSRGPGQLLLILRINSPSRALRRCAPLTSLRFYLPSALRRILGEKRRAHNVRPYGVFTNGSTYRKRDRSGTCPLKHRGETQFRTKFLCLLSFSKKVGYTGPWRKRSIISWVREMAEPPWGRFSRSNQVPSPSSSSWRVTVSSSVSRSQ